MNKIALFPDKVFPHWEAVAQILHLYLKGLGATRIEAEGTIGRLQARWARFEPPLAGQALHLVPPLRPDQERLPFEAETIDQPIFASRPWKTETARELLAFSMIDFRLSRQL